MGKEYLIMKKYYVDKEFRFRASESGWPQRFVKFDHEGDAETEKRLKRYQYNLAKAKEESLVIEDQGAFKSAAISSISIDRLIDITEPTPDSFIDLPVEVEFVKQWKRGNGEWIDVDVNLPINAYCETRTVARVRQGEAAEWLKAGLTPALVKKKIARLKEADLPSVPMDPNAGLSLGATLRPCTALIWNRRASMHRSMLLTSCLRLKPSSTPQTKGSKH
jgi:hypothetical protein